MLTLLKNVPLFASLGRKDVRFLEEIAKQVEFPAGTILFHEGDRGDRLYIIVEGRLEIVKAFGEADEHVLNICGTGEPVGEMSILNPRGVRSATVRTLTKARMIEVTREDFEMLLFSRPSLACGVARGLSQRLLDSENRARRILAEKDRKLSLLSKLLKTTSNELIICEVSKNEDDAVQHRPSVPRIRINVLGNFQVFRGEVPIGDREWKARQPKVLLKALIARGAAGVPKDVLIEDLWPEADPARAETNFKVVLHRLRKALHTAAKKLEGSPYVILKGNLLTLDRGLCSLDLDEFLAHCRKAKKCEQVGDMNGVLLSGTAAVAVYKGDFLAEDLYSPWAELKREELRTLYISQLRRTAELLESRGSARKATEFYRLIIKADPANEEAYQKLMLIHAGRGKEAEALRVYDECRRALEREVGVPPGTLTVSIYKRIIERTSAQ